MDSSETQSGSFRGRGRSSQFGAQEPIRTIPPDLVTKVGQGGTAVRLYSNYFSMMTPNDTIVHGYHVTFDPIVESPKIRRGLFFSHRDGFDSTYIFDGGADLKALKEISEPLTLFATTQHTNQSIEITIKYTGPISWGHPEIMRLYNTQMRRKLRHIGMTQIGSDFYNASEKKSIPDYRVEVWPGILTAINEHDGGIMGVVSCCHKIIRKDSALDILKRLWQQDRQNFQNNSRSELSGSIVMSYYNKKTYQIDDVIFQRNSKTSSIISDD